jgi:AcrR family transcriptional regulator
MAAVAEVVAERGYAATTIAEISRRARVAPNSFYAHFPNKLGCYLAAYDTLIQVLWTRMFSDLEPGAAGQESMLAILSGYLTTLEENPTIARAAIVELDAAGSVAREHRRRAFGQTAALIKVQHEEMRRRDPSLGPLPDRVYVSILHGARESVRDAIESGTPTRLMDLAPDILYWITATVRGASAAAELSESSRARSS